MWKIRGVECPKDSLKVVSSEKSNSTSKNIRRRQLPSPETWPQLLSSVPRALGGLTVTRLQRRLQPRLLPTPQLSCCRWPKKSACALDVHPGCSFFLTVLPLNSTWVTPSHYSGLGSNVFPQQPHQMTVSEIALSSCSHYSLSPDLIDFIAFILA